MARWKARITLAVFFLLPTGAFSVTNTELCKMEYADLTAAKQKLETRIAEASGPHIPPDREAEALLLKIENEIRRRNGQPPLPAPVEAPPRMVSPPPLVAAAPKPSVHDQKVVELTNKLSLLERKRIWLEEQDQFSTEPDPERKDVEREIEALTKELRTELELAKKARETAPHP